MRGEGWARTRQASWTIQKMVWRSLSVSSCSTMRPIDRGGGEGAIEAPRLKRSARLVLGLVAYLAARVTAETGLGVEPSYEGDAGHERSSSSETTREERLRTKGGRETTRMSGVVSQPVVCGVGVGGLH